MRKIAVVASLFVLSLATVAQAEGPQPQPYGQPQPGQPGAQPGQPQPGGVQVVEQQPAEQTRQAGRGIEYGAHLIVPIWVDSNLNLDPGFGIQGRIGWEFPGGLTVELNLGVMFNGSSVTVYDPFSMTTTTASGNFNNVWLGAGIRYGFLNPSAFVPFVGVGLAINDWGASCDGCIDSSREITLSFNGLAGFAYEISQQIALEAGLQVNYSLKGDVFVGDVTPMWLSPFLGGTLYY